MQTYSDVQYEKSVRYGAIKMRDLLDFFEKYYLQMIMGGAGFIPIGPISKIKKIIVDEGEKVRKKILNFVNIHQLFIHHRDEYDNELNPLIKNNDEHVRTYTVTDIVLTKIDPSQNLKSEQIKNEIYSLPDFSKIEKQKNEEKKRLKQIEYYNNLRNTLNEIYILLKSGQVNPNLESSRPLKLTPLLCAVILNDCDMIKLMVRDDKTYNSYFLNRFDSDCRDRFILLW